jgi:hypothetical protein
MVKEWDAALQQRLNLLLELTCSTGVLAWYVGQDEEPLWNFALRYLACVRNPFVTVRGRCFNDL